MTKIPTQSPRAHPQTQRLDPPSHAVRRVAILGTGSQVPDKVLTNAHFEAIVDTSDDWIRTRTGMLERRVVEPGQACSDLAIGAGRAALEQAGVDGADVQLIVVATFTPDTYCPPTACYVQHALGATRAAGYDLSIACSGFINAVANAQALIATGAYDNALVIGAEVMSSITDYEDRDTCVLFGDAAGAVLLGVDPDGSELLDTVVRIDGSGTGLISVPAGGSARPASAATVAAREHYLSLAGRQVFKFAVGALCDVVDQILARNGLQLSDVDVIVPHQANLRIIESAATRLGIPMDRLVINVDRYGNTSSASIPLALDEAVRDGRIQPGHIVCLVAFGAGLSWGATLLRW